MDQTLKEFLLTGWTDMGSGYALAIHPEHRTMYGGSDWVLIDTVKGRPDVYFGPESLFGDAPICGKVIARVQSFRNYDLYSSADADCLPQLYKDGKWPLPVVSDPDFSTFLTKVCAILPQREIQVRLGSPADRKNALERQLMAFECPYEFSSPRYSRRTSPENPLRSMTAGEKVHRFFLEVLHVDDQLDLGCTCSEPVLEAVLQHGDDRKEIYKEILKILDDSAIAEGGCGVDTFLRYLVERRLAEELDAMEAPYGFVYVSPDGLDIGGYGKNLHEAHWDLKFDRNYRAWRLMVATKRLILALLHHFRTASSCTTPKPAHMIVNGIVDLAGLKPAAGRKRKLPKLEWNGDRVAAWQKVHFQGKSLRAVAREFDVGAATLHRAIKPLDAFADLMVPGAMPMPGSDEDIDLGHRLLSVQQLAHSLRKTGLTKNLGAYPLLADVAAGNGEKHDWTLAKQQVIQAWLDGVVPLDVALEVYNCDTEAQLRATAAD